MRRIVLSLFLLMAFPVLWGQNLWDFNRLEVSAGIGSSFIFGDIGGFSRGKNLLGLKDLSHYSTRYNINGNVKYRLKKDLNLRLNLTTGRFHTSDKRGSNENRGFESKTSFFEPMMLCEYYFIKNKIENKYLFMKYDKKLLRHFFQYIDWYLMAGAGINTFNVDGNKALMDAVGYKEKSTAFVLPAGVGMSFVLLPKMNIGLELLGRYTFSDYIDGYHSKKHSKANDVYYTFNFTITYKMRSRK